MTTQPLAERTSDEIATLVAELRSAAGCPTKRLSRGGHEFVLAKHTSETATEFAETRELLWVAGATRVTGTHVEKLQTSAGAVDASHATVVTVGSGAVEPSLDGTVNHLSEDDLRSAMRRTDGLSPPSGRDDSGAATAPSDRNGTSDAGSGVDSERGTTRSAASSETDPRQSEQVHSRSGSTEVQSRPLIERVSAPLVIADTWNGTTTARQDTDLRSDRWQRTTHATDDSPTDLSMWGALDGSTTEFDES